MPRLEKLYSTMNSFVFAMIRTQYDSVFDETCINTLYRLFGVRPEQPIVWSFVCVWGDHANVFARLTVRMDLMRVFTIYWRYSIIQMKHEMRKRLSNFFYLFQIDLAHLLWWWSQRNELPLKRRFSTLPNAKRNTNSHSFFRHESSCRLFDSA